MTSQLIAEPSATDHVDDAIAPVSAGLGVGLAAVAAATLSTRSGLGVALALVAALVVVARVAGPRSLSARWCAGAGLLVPWLVVRDNGWLAVSIICTVVLVVGVAAVAEATGQRITDLSLTAAFRRVPPAPGIERPSAPDEELFWSIVRGVTAALPVVLLFWMLLAEADQVFASVVDLSDLQIPRLALFVLFVPLAGALVRFAADTRSTRPGRPVASARFGAVESSIVLGAVSALFAAFIALRLATLNRPVESDAWRSEVRSGFFQLLFVAGLTVLLVLAIRQASGLSGLTGRVRACLLYTSDAADD